MDTVCVIVGLGNPGRRYEGTRHNAGFAVADSLAASLRAEPWKSWLNLGEVSRADAGGKTVFLVKPLTYMNESGRMIRSFADYHKIQPQEVLICYDDFALELGRVRLRKSGSSGGQQGMESVLGLMGTEMIPRLRIGIGPKPPLIEWKDFVLSKFSGEEKPIFAQSLETARQAALMAVEKGLEAAMNRFNGGG